LLQGLLEASYVDAARREALRAFVPLANFRSLAFAALGYARRDCHVYEDAGRIGKESWNRMDK